MKTQDLQTNLRNLFLLFPAHQLCFQWKAGWQVFVSLDGHIWAWWFYLLPPPLMKCLLCSLLLRTCIWLQQGSHQNPQEFRILGSRQGECNWHKIWHKKYPAIMYVLCASLVSREGFLLLISLEKLGSEMKGDTMCCPGLLLSVVLSW